MRLVALLAALLAAPMLFLVARHGEVVDMTRSLVSAGGMALALYAAASIVGYRFPRAAPVTVALLFLAALLVRVLFGFVYEFSGRGFDGGFFMHVSLTSLAVGWDHFSRAIVLAVILLAAATFLVARLVGRQQRLAPAPALFLAPVSVALLVYGAAGAPEVHFAKGYLRYADRTVETSPPSAVDAAHNAALLEPIRGARELPLRKTLLEAEAPDEPLNLILVYLESFNEMLTEDSPHPGLTPRIAELKERFTVLSPVYSSAFLTIEGIANSQCGTLFDMEHANNALVTADGRLSELPCLADILAAAGYHQVYAGGAGLDFAGKGEFLSDHGFDELLGWEHWDAEGHDAIGAWGLPDDVLFEEGLEIVSRLHGRERPFNLTLLTIGTHLPGFFFEGCPEYSAKEDDHYLNAVHCTDYLFGRFVDELENRGILEDTVLFAQADHGVFENPEMQRLFGDAVSDTRLLTLVGGPAAVRERLARIATDAPDSSVNTVATVLDLLGVRHNTGFVLARSRFDPDWPPPYLLTRRLDLFDGEPVVNDPFACNSEETAGPLSLPLDDCGKARVMDALHGVNRAYSGQYDIGEGSGVCELAAEVAIDGDNGEVRIKWGSENLTRRFHHRGVRLSDGSRKGVYAVLLDEHDRVEHRLFFGADNQYDVWQLSQLIANGKGRVLLAANTAAAEVDASYRRFWPDILERGPVVYGEFRDGGIEPWLDLDEAARFVPASCEGGPRPAP